jgi:hypothetical protein
LGASIFLPKLRLGVFGDHAEIAVQVAVVEDVPFAHQRHVVFKNAFGAGHGFSFPFDFQQAVDELRVHFEARFDQADVLIAGAEQALNASADLHAGFHLVGVWYLQGMRNANKGWRPVLRGRLVK